MKPEQLIDCEGITLESNKPFAFSCCDCGLTHHMVIVSEDGKPVGFAVKRVAATPPGGAGDGLDEAAFLERFERNVEVRNDHCAAILAVGAGGSVGAVKPYAYAVYFPDQPCEELVHDLDELLDDLTNRKHIITPLYDKLDIPVAIPAPEQAAPVSVQDGKDARRYRILKDKCGFGIRRNGVVELTICFSEAEPAHIGELDMFLDAAIQASDKPPAGTAGGDGSGV